MGWRYIAQRIAGPNKGEFLHWNLPLSDVELTRALGSDWLTATVTPALPELHDDFSADLLRKWSTAIWAERDGRIWGGGILIGNEFDGPHRKIEVMGYGGYPVGIGYLDEFIGVEVDPIDVVRHLWDHVQSQPNGNLDMILDSTTSDIRIGEEEREVEFQTGAGEDVAFTAGPFKITWYEGDDCGEVIAKLASDTPFELREEHNWVGDSETIQHRLRIGYPRLGTRRTDLRFATGENIFVRPSVDDDGTEFANEIICLGAGEGRTIVYNRLVEANDDRLRRTYIFSDKKEKTKSGLMRSARELLPVLLNTPEISEVQVINHPNAPFGSWNVGDDILLNIETDWISFSKYYRVAQEIIRPAEADTVTLKVEPL